MSTLPVEEEVSTGRGDRKNEREREREREREAVCAEVWEESGSLVGTN